MTHIIASAAISNVNVPHLLQAGPSPRLSRDGRISQAKGRFSYLHRCRDHYCVSELRAAHLTTDALLTNLTVIICVYAISLALWFLWNFFVAAPVFLDNQLGAKITAMETADNERKKKVTDQERFVLLMADGQICTTKYVI